ncbi:hypothetical protein J1N35_012026 [Gossypium stocksii]|uniref:Uncharacterized protein n=1 Tax=Gossypium stocksii TaxID=47602 RepID=A0A9D3W5I9_9ROSI|nr:hypothetical protein J1N35_012026 [Gossypium stocksii]
MTRSCWLKKNPLKSNVVTFISEEYWDLEALFAIKKEGMVESQSDITRGKKDVSRGNSNDVATSMENRLAKVHKSMVNVIDQVEDIQGHMDGLEMGSRKSHEMPNEELKGEL